MSLPIARTAGLETSDVMLADQVVPRAEPYPPSEQASHPYAIGPMEVTPNRLRRFNREDNLSIVFQMINAQSTEAGMPDVAVNIRIVKLAGDRETPAAALNPHVYNATTLGPDFNLRLGHPLFQLFNARLMARVRRQKLRRPPAARQLFHPLPEMHGFTRIIPRVGGQENADIVRFGLEIGRAHV